MSAVIVVDCSSAGSAPTMLNPYVTPSWGLSAVPNQCATVLVVGNTFAPPTVMSEAWIAESGTAIGAGGVPALAVEARNGKATASPASTVSLRAMRRAIRSLRIADTSVALSHTPPDAALHHRTGGSPRPLREF